MKPASVDRSARTSIAAVLVFWTACLTVLWAWALDASPATTLSALAAALVGVACLSGRGPHAARLAGRMLGRSGAGAPAAVGLFAAVCGLCSASAVWASSLLADALIDAVLWSRGTWLAVSFAMQVAGMAPMALGICATLCALTPPDQGPGRTGAADIRTCLRALAGGLGGFALAWWLGVSLAAMSVVTGLLLTAASLLALQRQARAAPNLPPEPAADPRPGRRGKARLCVIAAAGAVLVGAVLAGHLAWFGPATCAALVAAAAALADWFLSRRPSEARRTLIDLRAAAGSVAAGLLLVVLFGVAVPGRAPAHGNGRSDRIGQLLAETIAGGADGRRWWIVAASPLDAPAALPARAMAMRASVASTDRRRIDDAGHLQGEFGGDFLAALRAGRGGYDGIVLAPARGDGPLAWRCYSSRTLRLCAARLHDQGVMILRTQADRNRPGDVLAVAAAFRQAIGSGWAAVAWGEGQVDILLAGPTELVPAPAARRGLAVVDLRALADRWPQVGPLRMTHPRGVFAPAPTARAFGLWLRSKHK